MDFPDLSKLPPWAALVFVVCLAVLFVATRTGWLQGLKSTPSTSHAEVAAVIVDPKALNAATDAILLLNGTMAQIADLIGQYLVNSRDERSEREWDESVEEEVERRLNERTRPKRQPSRRASARPNTTRG